MPLVPTLSQIHSSAGSACRSKQEPVEEGLGAIERAASNVFIEVVH
jgi:hypothetical protein